MSETILLTPSGKRRGRKPGLNSTIAQRGAANARERSRMRVLSGAFIDLKSALPWVPRDTKLSKLDTLKLAAGYIAYLRRVLDLPADQEGDGSNGEVRTTNHPIQFFGLIEQESDDVMNESTKTTAAAAQPKTHPHLGHSEFTSPSLLKPSHPLMCNAAQRLPNSSFGSRENMSENQLTFNYPAQMAYHNASSTILAHRMPSRNQHYSIVQQVSSL